MLGRAVSTIDRYRARISLAGYSPLQIAHSQWLTRATSQVAACVLCTRPSRHPREIQAFGFDFDKEGRDAMLATQRLGNPMRCLVHQLHACLSAEDFGWDRLRGTKPTGRENMCGIATQHYSTMRPSVAASSGKVEWPRTKNFNAVFWECHVPRKARWSQKKACADVNFKINSPVSTTRMSDIWKDNLLDHLRF